MGIDLGRDPRRAASSSYDLVVVGGGIYGAAAALEAARRDLSVLLLERGDFGGATSWNSLRIVHGGLRYLQSLDLPRFRESVTERRWFLRSFPDLVEPLPCLMPLYSPPRGGRLRRASVLRLAMAANDLLSRRRNAGVRPDRALPPGRLLGRRETAGLFPGVDGDGLCGGALWYDAVTPDSQRLMIEILRWAASLGARPLNYVEAEDLRLERGRVAGVRAVDRVTGESLEFTTGAVLNCAGPWSRRFARRCDRDLPSLFRPVLAFNLLLDREPPSRAALAVAAPAAGAGGAQTWFLLPWKGRILAGTAYVPADVSADWEREEAPAKMDPARLLAELDAAIPGFGGDPGEVLRVHWGWLPAAAEGSTVPAARPVVHDHGRHGGPEGLVSVSGVKLTTARAVAERALALLVRRARGRHRLPAPAYSERPAADPPPALAELVRLAERDRGAAQALLRAFVERQAVIRLDDLLLRRTDWGVFPEHAAAAERLCRTLGWREPWSGPPAAVAVAAR